MSVFIINPYAFGGGPDYQDNFEAHAVATGIPAGWAQVASGGGTLNPTWSVTSTSPLAGAKSLQAVAASAGQRGLGFTGSSLLDGEVEALVSGVTASADNVQPGIIARATDANNWIGARISALTGSKSLRLQQVAAGVTTLNTDAYAFAENTTYRIRLVLASGVATAYAYSAGGTLLASTSLAISIAAGQVGLLYVGDSATIKWDNFKATIAP